MPGNGGLFGVNRERGEVVARYRATGTAAAKPMGGHRRDFKERTGSFRPDGEKPDLTLRAVLAELATPLVELRCGLGVLREREGITFKKPAASGRIASDVARRRWKQHQGRLTCDAWCSRRDLGQHST